MFAAQYISKSLQKNAVGTDISWIDCDRCTPSLLRYSVFRNHGTWAGSGVEELVTTPDVGPFENGVELEEGSPNRNRSFGSRVGRLSGSGFSAVRRSMVSVEPRVQEAHAPESSASSSHSDSQRLKSSGMPHSASTIIGRGVSFAMAFKNSGRA